MDGIYLPAVLTDFSRGSMIVLSLTAHAMYSGAADYKRGFTFFYVTKSEIASGYSLALRLTIILT